MSNEGQKYVQDIGNETGRGLEKAIDREVDTSGPSEANQHARKAPDSSGKKPSTGSGEPDENTWKLIGGVVAVVAAIALGVTIKKKSGGKKEDAKEEAHGVLDEAGRKLKEGGRWFGDKANVAQEKTGELAGAVGNVVDDIGPRISGAASVTKEKASEIVPTPVQDAASNVADQINLAGINAEKEGLKASEKSDHAVRKAADKVLHHTDKASTKADHKSGGVLSGIGNWFRDRRDDAAELVDSAADKGKK